MGRSTTEQYRFDRLFMSHLGSKLRAEYEPLVKSPLPERHKDLVLNFALGRTGSDPEELRARLSEKVPHLPS